MGLGSYWRIFARQWFLIILMTVLCVAGTAAYSLLVTPSYSSTVRLFVAARDAGASAVDQQAGATFAQARVSSYVELIDSSEVLTQVIQQLELSYTPAQLAKELSATNVTNTVNIVVTVKDRNPQRAADIANAFAPAFSNYVAKIEDVNVRTGSPVGISVTKPATVATTPDSPKTTLNLILGLFVGLGLGLVAAVAREQTNSFIIGGRDIERITGAVPLGVVPFDRSTTRHPLVSPSEQSGRAEAFRGLRTNLQFADVDNPPGRIVITSAVPGEGKSTVAANIAFTLAVGGAKVVLVEADLRGPTLSTYLGISNAAGLTNVLAGQYTLSEVLIRHRSSNNLAVLTCGPKPPNPAELLNSTQMENVLIVLGEHFDYVVIDSPPLLRVTEAAVLAAIADGALLVVHHRKTKREQLVRAIGSLTTVNARVLGTVLNFAPAKEGSWEGYGKTNGKDPRHADFYLPQGNMFAELGEIEPVRNGPAQNSPVQNGPVPNGPVPNGPVSNGSVPNGSVPTGAVPNGSAQFEPLLTGETPGSAPKPPGAPSDSDADQTGSIRTDGIRTDGLRTDGLRTDGVRTE